MLFALRLAPVKFDLLLVLERLMGLRRRRGRELGGGLLISPETGGISHPDNRNVLHFHTNGLSTNQNSSCLNSGVDASSTILLSQTIRPSTETVVLLRL